jgi:uncharacterized membrane protein YbaN (DUF454 family)
MTEQQTRSVLEYFLLFLGWLCVALGVIGIFLPIMPTTPFLLVAAWCFARSSERFYHWLLNHKRLGPIVSAWQNGDGLPRRLRNRILFLLWFSLCSTSLIIHQWWVAAGLFVLGCAVSAYMLSLPVAGNSGGMRDKNGAN